MEMKESDLAGMPQAMIDKFKQGKEGYRVVPLQKQEIGNLMKLL
jgi:hypothetical protein